jgi:hypothetical protein
METAPLDPSLPGVRMLQNWIREGLAVSYFCPKLLQTGIIVLRVWYVQVWIRPVDFGLRAHGCIVVDEILGTPGIRAVCS